MGKIFGFRFNGGDPEIPKDVRDLLHDQASQLCVQFQTSLTEKQVDTTLQNKYIEIRKRQTKEDPNNPWISQAVREVEAQLEKETEQNIIKSLSNSSLDVHEDLAELVKLSAPLFLQTEAYEELYSILVRGAGWNVLVDLCQKELKDTMSASEVAKLLFHLKPLLIQAALDGKKTLKPDSKKILIGGDDIKNTAIALVLVMAAEGKPQYQERIANLPGYLVQMRKEITNQEWLEQAAMPWISAFEGLYGNHFTSAYY